MPTFFPDLLALRRIAVIPLTLVPFAADPAQALRAIPNLSELDKGLYVKIDGEEVFLCTFTMCFLGDMVEQQEIAGCLSHQGNKSCRFCLIDKQSRDDLDFDIVKQGRYYHYMNSIRSKQAGKAASARKKALSGMGLRDQHDMLDAVRSFTPALDHLRCTVIDFAHSEWTSLVKRPIEILRTEILTPRAAEEFNSELRQFPLPPDFIRIQSVKHTGSWRMTECAQAIIMIPVLSRVWLTTDFVKPDFQRAVTLLAPRFLPDLPAGMPATDIIVSVFWALAQSTIIIAHKRPAAMCREKIEQSHLAQQACPRSDFSRGSYSMPETEAKKVRQHFRRHD